MTVAVETPEGIRTGSAVREIHAFREPKLLPEQSAGHAAVVKGEAVIVDLGKLGLLFAPLRNAKWGMDYGYHVVFDAFPYKPGKYLSAEANAYYRTLIAGPVTLAPEHYPLFLHFKDLSDPKTVVAVSALTVDSTLMSNNRHKVDTFESAFGTGVHLKSVSLEMTTDPVTWKIEKLLPWLPNYYNQRLDGDRFGYSKAKYPIANSLASGDFLVGRN